MPTSTMFSTTGELVGSFETLDGAALAVSHLVELQYDPADMAIAPRDFNVVNRDRRRDRTRNAVWRGAAAAAAIIGAGAAIWVLGFDTLVFWILPSMLIAAVVGGAVGAVGAVMEHRYASLFVDADRAPELRPTTFDIVVDRGAARARNELARWWDPAARPSQRHRVAGAGSAGPILSAERDVSAPRRLHPRRAG